MFTPQSEKTNPSIESAAGSWHRVWLTPRRELVLLLAILCLGALLRVAYLAEIQSGVVLHFPNTLRPFGDDFFVDDWARNVVYSIRGDNALLDPMTREAVARGGQPRDMIYFRPPLYPYFVSLVFLLTDCRYAALWFVQMTLGIVSAWLAYRLSRQLFGPTGALFTALFMCTHWLFIYYEAEVQPIALNIFLILLGVNLCLAWARSQRLCPACAAALVLGVLGISWNVWSVALVPPLFAMGVHAVRLRKLRRSLSALILFGLLGGMATSPVFVRDALHGVKGKTATWFAANLWMGNNEFADGTATIPRGLWPMASAYSMAAHLRKFQAEQDPAATFRELSAVWRAQVLRYIQENPRRFVHLCFRRASLFWGNRETAHGFPEYIVKQLSPTLRSLPYRFDWIVALATVGLVGGVWRQRSGVALLKTHPATANFLMVLLSSYVFCVFAVHLPFFVSAMHRLSIVPLLFVFAGGALTSIAETIRRRAWKGSLALGGAAALSYALVSLQPVDYSNELYRWHSQRYIRSGNFNEATAEVQAIAQRLAARGELTGPAADLARPEVGRAMLATLHANAAAWHFQSFQLDMARDEVRQALAIDPDLAWAADLLRAIQSAPPEYKRFFAGAGLTSGSDGGAS